MHFGKFEVKPIEAPEKSLSEWTVPDKLKAEIPQTPEGRLEDIKTKSINLHRKSVQKDPCACHAMEAYGTEQLETQSGFPQKTLFLAAETGQILSINPGHK